MSCLFLSTKASFRAGTPPAITGEAPGIEVFGSVEVRKIRRSKEGGDQVRRRQSPKVQTFHTRLAVPVQDPEPEDPGLEKVPPKNPEPEDRVLKIHRRKGGDQVLRRKSPETTFDTRIADPIQDPEVPDLVTVPPKKSKFQIS